MNFDVARDTQRLKVRRAEAQLFHLLRGACAFDRYLVMHVDGTAHVPFFLAQLAEWVLIQLPCSEFFPSLGVQQPLIVFRSAHSRSPFISVWPEALRLQLLRDVTLLPWLVARVFLRVCIREVFLYHCSLSSLVRSLSKASNLMVCGMVSGSKCFLRLVRAPYTIALPFGAMLSACCISRRFASSSS